MLLLAPFGRSAAIKTKTKMENGEVKAQIKTKTEK